MVRRERVMLDQELAELYGVPTKVLLQSVRRNLDRFPSDFMFQLTASEFAELRSRTPAEGRGRGGRRTRPYAFTEHGVAMLSSVLNSPRAIAVNIEIMRTFVRLRQAFALNEQLARKLRALESKYDKQFRVVFDAIRALMEPPEEPEPAKSPIGFRAD